MRLAICDDEKIFREVIIKHLQPYIIDFGDITFDEFDSGEDVLEAYNSGNRFDLLFLDIQLSKITGIDVAREVKRIDDSAIFIFVTGYFEYIREAFSVNAFQYLLKPVKKEVFKEEFERALNAIKTSKYVLKVSYNDIINQIKITDILYIETYNRHLRVVTSTNKFEYIGKIGDEESKLEEYGFLRCHQGCLVNMHYINSLEKNKVKLTIVKKHIFFEN